MSKRGRECEVKKQACKRRAATLRSARVLLDDETWLYAVGGLGDCLAKGLSELSWELEGENSSALERHECMYQAIFLLGESPNPDLKAALRAMLSKVKGDMKSADLTRMRRDRVAGYPEELKKQR